MFPWQWGMDKTVGAVVGGSGAVEVTATEDVWRCMSQQCLRYGLSPQSRLCEPPDGGSATEGDALYLDQSVSWGVDPPSGRLCVTSQCTAGSLNPNRYRLGH
jgi:hypothetical protein